MTLISWFFVYSRGVNHAAASEFRNGRALLDGRGARDLLVGFVRREA